MLVFTRLTQSSARGGRGFRVSPAGKGRAVEFDMKTETGHVDRHHCRDADGARGVEAAAHLAAHREPARSNGAEGDTLAPQPLIQLFRVLLRRAEAQG